MAGLLGLLSDAAELTSKTAKVAPKVAKAGEVMSIPAEIAAQFVKAADPAHIRGAEIMDMLKSGRRSEVTDQMLDMGNPVLNARLNEYLYRNADIPMDEASRMARARDMGIDIDSYHGTLRDYSAAKPETYTTPDPNYANIYAGGQFSEGGNVIPLLQRNADILNTKTPTGNSVFDKEFFMKYGNGTPLTDRGFPDWTDGPDFGEMFTDAGLPYNGVFLDEGKIPLGDGTLLDRGISTLHFDPTNIRSRFARFDPRLSHLKNLSASVGAGLLGAGMMPKNDGRR